MKCISCVKKIKETLSNVPGFINIEVYLEDGKAFLEYDNDLVTCQDIIERINGLDLQATLIKDEEALEPAPSPTPTGARRKGGNGDDVQYAKLTMSIEGMVCHSCVDNIQSNVGKLAGVVEVVVNLAENCGHVVFEKNSSEGVDQAAILSRIDDLGFDTADVVETLLPSSYCPPKSDEDEECKRSSPSTSKRSSSPTVTADVNKTQVSFIFFLSFC